MSDDKQLSIFAEMNLEQIFTHHIDDFTDEQAAKAWAMIDAMGKVIEERKKNLRDSLQLRAQETGSKKENGSFEAKMGEVTIINERRQEKLPSEEVVKACLKEAGLEYEDAFTAQMVWTMDPSKVDFLVQGGKLPADKIEASKKVSYALKVKPDKDLKEKLDAVKKRLSSGDK